MKIPFNHPLEINIGFGRIIYVEEHITENGRMPEGWRLPGGGITTNKEIAEQVARKIDELTNKFFDKKYATQKTRKGWLA